MLGHLYKPTLTAGFEPATSSLEGKHSIQAELREPNKIARKSYIKLLKAQCSA